MRRYSVFLIRTLVVLNLLLALAVGSSCISTRDTRPAPSIYAPPPEEPEPYRRPEPRAPAPPPRPTPPRMPEGYRPSKPVRPVLPSYGDLPGRDNARGYTMYCTDSNIHGSYPKGGGCNIHGCYPRGGGCNIHGCWPAGGSCNIHGCTERGECNIHGCPAPVRSKKFTCTDVPDQDSRYPYYDDDYRNYDSDSPVMLCSGSNMYGSYPEGGGCNMYGCYPSGAGCNMYGCYPRGGSCNMYGCTRRGSCNMYNCPDRVDSIKYVCGSKGSQSRDYDDDRYYPRRSPSLKCAHSNAYGSYAEGGGCNAFGCYAPGGGCNAFGCYPEGGSCNAFGCSREGSCDAFRCPDRVSPAKFECWK